MKIYLDMDGVLADFEAHKYKYFKDSGLNIFSTADPNGHPKEDDKKFWEIVWDKYPRWFFHLPVMPGALELLNTAEILAGQENVAVLTAVSKSHLMETAKQKYDWLQFHFGTGTTPIICRRKHKRDWAEPDAVLVDDSESNIKEWVGKGGIGVLFTSSKQAIDQLEKISATLRK